MEYLMTYGWAVLVIAIVASLLFALGVFNGLFGTPNVCAPQPRFTCTDLFYGTNGISATISQTSGQYYTGTWAFIVSSSEYIGSSGLPVNFSTSSTANMLYIGQLRPSQTVPFTYANTTGGGIPKLTYQLVIRSAVTYGWDTAPFQNAMLLPASRRRVP